MQSRCKVYSIFNENMEVVESKKKLIQTAATPSVYAYKEDMPWLKITVTIVEIFYPINSLQKIIKRSKSIPIGDVPHFHSLGISWRQFEGVLTSPLAGENQKTCLI